MEETLIDNEETSTNDRVLEYPRDFFEPIGGSNPPDIEAAALLWQYRKERPTRNAVELKPADGGLMMIEIKAMRQRLRYSIIAQFMDSARYIAKQMDLRMPCGAMPITPKDLKCALGSLSSDEANHLLVFNICHFAHTDRNWMCNALDNWFRIENMRLLEASTDSSTKFYKCSRGGFGNVARQAKSYAVQSMMKPMFKAAKWCIATTNNLRACKTLNYKRYELFDENKNRTKYYVVTPSEKVVSADTDFSLNSDAITDRELVDVSRLDYAGMAATLSQQLGVTVSETVLKSLLLANFRPDSSEVLVQNSVSMSPMSPEYDSCSNKHLEEPTNTMQNHHDFRPNSSEVLVQNSESMTPMASEYNSCSKKCLEEPTNTMQNHRDSRAEDTPLVFSGDDESTTSGDDSEGSYHHYSRNCENIKPVSDSEIDWNPPTFISTIIQAPSCPIAPTQPQIQLIENAVREVSMILVHIIFFP